MFCADRVIVCGGRDLDVRKSHDALSRAFHGRAWPRWIFNGGAGGADEAAREWALSHEIGSRVFPADWATHGRAAGPIRNQQMLDEGQPDLVVALWDGSSRGTEDMIRRAVKAGVPVEIIPAGDLK